MKDSSLDELVKVLDMGEGDLSVCGELCKGLDPGAIFDASIGDYGSHLLSSEQVTALQTYITKREREAEIKGLTYAVEPDGVANIPEKVANRIEELNRGSE